MTENAFGHADLYYNSPVVAPPKGEESNFLHGWTPVLVATVVMFSIMFTMSTASLAIRYVTSAFLIKKLEPDVGGLSFTAGKSEHDTHEAVSINHDCLVNGSGELSIRSLVHTARVGPTCLECYNSRRNKIE